MRPSPLSMQGQRIDKYRLIRQLGEGGMGVVYEAVREDLGGRVALKLIRAEFALNREVAARFYNEARAANLIEHPGVVRVFDYGQVPGGGAYLAMEYVDGESLSRRQERLRQFTSEEVLRLGRQIASAIAAAHARQIVHRDLKPDNIMLVPDVETPGGERIKVLDFGIAKLATELRGVVRTQANIVMGTPVYMAPEQCRGNKGVGEKADVYALGVILYELLAGRPPFVGEDAAAYIGMHMFKEPPALRQFAAKAPERLLNLVHAMLIKDSDQRPAMADVAQELRQLTPGHSDSLPALKVPSVNESSDDSNLTVPLLKRPQRVSKEPGPTAAYRIKRTGVSDSDAKSVTKRSSAPDVFSTSPSVPMEPTRNEISAPPSRHAWQTGSSDQFAKESDEPETIVSDLSSLPPMLPPPQRSEPVSHPSSTQRIRTPEYASQPPHTPPSWFVEAAPPPGFADKSKRSSKGSGSQSALAEKQTAQSWRSPWQRLIDFFLNSPASARADILQPADTTEIIRLGSLSRLRQNPRALMFIGLGTGIVGAILVLIALAAASSETSKKSTLDSAARPSATPLSLASDLSKNAVPNKATEPDASGPGADGKNGSTPRLKKPLKRPAVSDEKKKPSRPYRILD